VVLALGRVVSSMPAWATKRNPVCNLKKVNPGGRGMQTVEFSVYQMWGRNEQYSHQGNGRSVCLKMDYGPYWPNPLSVLCLCGGVEAMCVL
jgi:hypothetical protein